MNPLGTLENGLFALGQVLRFPVITLLWVCVGAALFYAGATLMEFLARRRERQGFDLKRWLRANPPLAADAAALQSLPAELRQLAAHVAQERRQGTLAIGDLENLVAELDERLRRRLSGPRALVKIGPSLGLMGTLIPMGASLAAMAGGNLQAMAAQMVVAFTTTIIGLATGTAAYAVTAVRHNWVNESIREQRYLAERIAEALEREPGNRHAINAPELENLRASDEPELDGRLVPDEDRRLGDELEPKLASRVSRETA